ncbi:MAG: GNAT family N-acetyltransferase [Bryobacteraceae bacterium]
MPRPLIDRIRVRAARAIVPKGAVPRGQIAGRSGDFTIELTESTGDDVESLREALYAHNARTVGNSEFRALNVLLRDGGGRVVGGVLGSTYWKGLSIDYVWVAPQHRGRKHSHRLIRIAEEEAVRRGCECAFLDTFSFQEKVGLYQSMGYEVYGVLEDFPPGHQRYFMRKSLKAGVPAATAMAGSGDARL